jgi:O-antigen/teichoic acid export membrane protein
MRSTSFFKGIFWLLLLNFLVKPAWIFLIDRQVQNTIGQEAYGHYFAVLNLSYIFFFFSDVGLTNALTNRLAGGEAPGLLAFLRLKLALLGLYLALFALTAWLTRVHDWTLAAYVIAIQIATSFFVFLRAVVAARQFFLADAWFSVIDKFLMILFCGTLLYQPGWMGAISLQRFLQWQLLATALSITAILWFIGAKGWLKPRPVNKMPALFRSTLPYAGIVLLMSVHDRLDGFLLDANGAYEAGVYAAAYRLLDAGNMTGYLVASFLLPYLSRHLTEKERTEPVIRMAAGVLLTIGIAAALFTAWFAPWLQQLLYHSDLPYQSLVLALCMASLPAYYLFQVYGTVLTAAQQFRPMLVILLVSVALNAVLNALLIPSWGAQGCCIAALVSQYTGGFLLYSVVVRKSGNSAKAPPATLLVLAALALPAFFYGAKFLLLNVWLILAVTALFLLLLMAWQYKGAKKLLRF